MALQQGQRMLIVADDWMQAADGRQFKMAWGRCWFHNAKEMFGFDPKAGANYFAQIGQGDGALFIAGCRIHYAYFCESRPNNHDVYIAPSERE